MAWTNPRTWVSGEVVTAALLNTHLRDNLLALYNTTPVYQSSSLYGPSGNFNNTAQANWSTPTWAFTPTATGWAWITVEMDTQDVTAGYGAATGYVKADGVQIDGWTFRFEGLASSSWNNRMATRWRCITPVRVTAGTSVTLSFDVSCFSGAGSWKINGFTWRVVTSVA